MRKSRFIMLLVICGCLLYLPYGNCLASSPSDILAANTELIVSYIDSNDILLADTAYQELIVDFADHRQLFSKIDTIASAYRKIEKFNKAKELYKYTVDYSSDDSLTIQSQTQIAVCDIKLKNHSDAKAAADKLLSDYLENELLPKHIYEIADEYRLAIKPQEALQLYQYIISNWPDHERTSWALAGEAICYIMQNDDAKVQAALEKLINDFSEDPHFQEHIRNIGSEYYKIALDGEGHYYYCSVMDCGNLEGVDSVTRDNYRKALEIWQNSFSDIITSDISAHIHFFSAVCYSKMDQYESAVLHLKKVVNEWPTYVYTWDAQYLVGLYNEEIKARDITLDEELYDEIDEEIITAYNLVLLNYPQSPDYKRALLRLGWTHCDRKDWASAIGTLERFRVEFPNDFYTPDALYDLSAAYKSIGDEDSADMVFNEIPNPAELE